jgi:putative copper resistance protein D
MGDLGVLARIVHFAATLLAAGTVCFLVLVAEPAAPQRPVLDALTRRCRHMAWTALAVTVISGAVWLLLLAAAIAGEPVMASIRDGTIWAVAGQTRFGQIWGFRLGLAVLLGLLLCAPAQRDQGYVSLLVAGAFVALVAFVGHSGASPGPAGQAYLAADMVHLLAAAAWIGGLPGLAVLLAMTRSMDDPLLRGATVDAVHRFSILGIVSVGALLVTGSINSWHLLDSLSALSTTAYGRLLSIKIILFAGLIAIAAINRLHVTPNLPAAGALRIMKRNVIAEAALGLCIIAIVGALGTMSPGNPAHERMQAPQPAAVHSH